MRIRFEILAAYVLGVGLPIAETLRRRTDFSSVAAYADDFIAGALLLIAARAASSRRPSGNALLVAAWAVVCGGGYYSFFGQLEHWDGRDPSGLPNAVVVAIKGALLLLACISLALSIRATRRDAIRAHPGV